MTTEDVPLWKRLAGTLVELDDKPPAAPAAKPVTVAPSVPPQQATAEDRELHAALMKSALNRKTAFSGLIESAERLRSVPGLDDTQRIKSAAAMAGNVTIEMITQAAASHTGDIALERGKFNREITNSKSTRVDLLLSQATTLDSQVQATQAEIQRLTEQVATMTSSATTLRTQAAAAVDELTQVAATFEAAAAQVEQYITTTRDSIVSALK